MGRRPLIIGGVCAWVALALCAAAFAQTPRSVVARVDRVSDGDSVVATSDTGTTLRLRLLGIDAPEIAHGPKPGQPYGEEARDYLDHLIGGKHVRVDGYGADRYHRLLAVLWDGHLNVNLLLVAMGYAEVYRGAACQVDCRELDRAEAKAKRELRCWSKGHP